nr:hypothetical protein [Tanacetum cinerariifolium]
DTELGGYVREFEKRVRQDMDEIYTRLDDEQTERQLLAEKRGHERPMRVTLFMEADCDFRVTEAQVATLQGHQGQQGLARDSTHPESPEEAGGSA